MKELPYFSHAAAEEQSDQTQVQAMKKKGSFDSNTVQSKYSRQALRALIRKEYTSSGRLKVIPQGKPFSNMMEGLSDRNSFCSSAEMEQHFGAIRTQAEHPPALVSGNS